VYVAQVKGAFYQLFPWPWYYSRGPLWHWRISEVRWHIDANRFLAPAAKISARGRRSAGDIHLNHSERPGVWSRQPRSNFSASRLQPWTVRERLSAKQKAPEEAWRWSARRRRLMRRVLPAEAYP